LVANPTVFGRVVVESFYNRIQKTTSAHLLLTTFGAPLWVLRECEVPFRFGKFFHTEVS
jgi:hypothetical protein